MELVKSMKVNDLYIGDVEGKNEFANKNIELIENTFLKLDHLENNFINKNQYFIYGHKGTGKTSLLKYIEYKVKQNDDTAITILFKDIKQEPLTYTTFKTLLSQAEDKDTAAITFWQWFILSVIVNDIFPNYLKKDDLIFNAKNSMFQILSKFLVKLIGGVGLSASSDDMDLDMDVPDFSTLNETNEVFSAALKIKKLEKYIKNNLNKKIYLLIDELETSTLTTSFKEDSILIKNLVLTVEKLNSISDNLTLVIAVRTEVLNNVFTSGAELNKLLESKGEETKWTYDNFGEKHPLIQMMIKKFRYSMTKFMPSEAEQIKNATNDEIFKRWFPNKLMDDENGNNAKFLLHNTWNKPRDLVRFLQIMQKKAKDKNYFERTEYDQSVKEYSSKAWIELKEELISILTDKEIQDIENTFANYAKMFRYEELIDKFLEKTNLELPKIKEIIRVLYKVGFIGNNYKNGTTQIYRYSYRGDNILDENERIEVHRGLWRTFSLKHELKYKSSIIHEPDENIYSSLADKLREI